VQSRLEDGDAVVFEHVEELEEQGFVSQVLRACEGGGARFRSSGWVANVAV
jgi:hypothetical protein